MTDNPQPANLPNPFGHSMKYGLQIGACLGIAFILSAIGKTGLAVAAWLIQIMVLVFAYRYARHYRDTECGGKMRYSQAFSYILLLFFFAALVGGLIKFLYMQYIDPTFLERMFSESMLLFEQMGLELPAEQIAQVETLMTPINYTLQVIMGDCLLGLLLGLVYGLFLKR